MSRPRTATAILDAKGAFRKDPARRRKDPEVKDPFPGEAPADLEPLEVKWWHLLAKQVPAGVLTGADQAKMTIMAGLMAEYMADRKGMATARLSLLDKMMGQFGLSPSDRAKLATSAEDDSGDF